MVLTCVGALNPATAAFADTIDPIDWQARTRTDLEAFARAAKENYIYAAYPDPAQWQRKFDRDYAEVRSKIALVRDEAGYQAVVRYLVSTFHDAHVSVRFTTPPTEVRWPGFLSRFDNGVYRITASRRPDVRDGATVESCDGQPVAWWIETVARYESGLPVALEATRMSSALRLFVDRGSSLRPRPNRCVIDGRSIAIDWQPVSAKEIAPFTLSWQGARCIGGHHAGGRVPSRDSRFCGPVC